jgi:hypothetical protein
MPITHAKVSGKSDGGDATLVLPSDWNAAHTGISGTSFPGSPASGDLLFRTDLGMLAYYDGTRWLTVNEYAVGLAVQDTLVGAGTGSPQTPGYLELDNASTNLYLTRLAVSTTVLTTNSGTSFWTVAFTRQPSATSLGSFNTSADTVSVNTRHDITINALSGTSDRYVTGAATKTVTPGVIYTFATLFFRKVLT